MVQWYSRHLYALMEPLLFNRRFRDKEIYRFTWLRTFDNPIVIRIERNPDGLMLFWKKSDGMGGYEPGKIIIDESKSLNEDHWQQFIDLVQKANYWNLDYGRFSYGTDGSEWILDGVDPDNYRVIAVWYPGKGYFYEACRYLLSLTGMNIPEKDIY